MNNHGKERTRSGQEQKKQVIFGTVGQKTEVADAHKALRENVEHEAARQVPLGNFKGTGYFFEPTKWGVISRAAE